MGFAGPATAQTSHSLGVNAKPYGHLNAAAGSSSIGRYDPYAPPRRPVPSTSTASTSSTTPSKCYKNAIARMLKGIAAIRFKSSPFIRVERAVSAVVECPGMIPLVQMSRLITDREFTESSSATDRRQQTVTFNLTNDYVAKLGSSA